MFSSPFKSSLSVMTRSCRLRVPSHTRISTTKRSPCTRSQAPILIAQRQFSRSAWQAYPRKDSQDKDSINTEATEYSKSATDDENARQEDAAFNPDITDPQQQKDVAENRKDDKNPLEVSPANPEVSKQRGSTEGGAENSSAGSSTTSDKQRSSGGGSPMKGSKIA